MRNFKLLLVGVFSTVLISNCDISTPGKPDFTTSHSVEAPLLLNKTLQFLGGGDGAPEALLDTTKSDFDSLFTVTDGGIDDGLITLSRTEEFDFGDLNDAIPEIGIDPTSFNSQVGEIEIGSFSSGNGDLGSVDIEEVTGSDPNIVPAGTPIPAGDNSANPVQINIGANTDFFVSATIKRGSIDIQVTNNLGFNFSVAQVQFIDTVSSTPIGSVAEFSNANGNQLIDGATEIASVTFSDGDVLQNLGVQLTIFWNAFTFPANPDLLAVNSVDGNGLTASAVEAAVTEQDFSTASVTTFDATEFQFTSDDHFVQLESGVIELGEITNSLDLSVETLIISFPGIRSSENEADSLRLEYSGATEISRNGSAPARSIDLAGYFIYANGNQINYNIQALTENTQDAPVGDQTRVIRETDEVSSSVAINNLKVARAFGEIQSQTVLLGDDDPSNGLTTLGNDIVDAYNETEVSLTEIDGLDDLSSEIDGIEFAGASLSITYTSNIGVPTTIYAAIVGVDGEGEEIFLTGTNGSDKVVSGTDPIDGIYANGVQLRADQLIKFQLDPSPDGSVINSSVIFDGNNTNVLDFLNNLPSEIRFVGKSVINQSNGEATIATPLEFDPSILVDLPIYFSAASASYETTVDGGGLDGLPEEGEDTDVTSGELVITYENGLPLGFILNFDFFEANGDSVTTVPIPGEDPIRLAAAPVDAVNRFVTVAEPGQLIISLNDNQLDQLSRTDSVTISATLDTFSQEAVKIRDTDSITISISAKASVRTNVGGN
jgi:hypothetical protein